LLLHKVLNILLRIVYKYSLELYGALERMGETRETREMRGMRGMRETRETRTKRHITMDY
jgi:hypothetical protein